MARQTGIIKLEGTIGDISFYKTRDGHLARTKSGVDGERIQNDPAAIGISGATDLLSGKSYTI